MHTKTSFNFIYLTIYMPKTSTEPKKTRKKADSKSKTGVVTGEGEDSVTLLTREGLEKLTEELAYLTTVRRRDVAKRLKEAISYGDLSENSEYEDAKNEQAFVEGRIMELEEKIKSAKIIEERYARTSVVQLGMRIKVQNLSARKKNTVEEFTIVGSTEADPFNNKISNESPVGKGLLGSAVGDIVEFVVPAGVRKYKVLEIG